MKKQSVILLANGIALIAFCMASATVIAQPGNPGPDPGIHTVVDLGDVTIGVPIQSADITVPASPNNHVWFRFRLLTPISPLVNWLDLDTAGPSGITNTEMAIYDARANNWVTMMTVAAARLEARPRCPSAGDRVKKSAVMTRRGGADS